MLLKKLQINSFGCLNDYAAEFQPGLNIIRGPNESGKSTLHQALLMALMVLPNQNQANSVWRAWGSKQWYRLHLSFADRQGKEYDLAKDFEAGYQELRLPDGQTTRNRDTIDQTLQAALGTSSHLMLRSTLCVEQDALAELAKGNREISQSLETIVTGSEDDIYTEQALKQLDKKMREFRVGFNRMSSRPGPLAAARDVRARLKDRVVNYQDQVRNHEDDERSLEEAEIRLAEVLEQLGPMHTTREQLDRTQKVQDDLAGRERSEAALEAILENVRSTQNETKEAEEGLQKLGAVAQLSEEGVRTAGGLYSRATTLQEEYSNHQKSMVRYEQDLAAHREQRAAYVKANADYKAAKAAYEQAQEAYQAQMDAYEAAVAQYNRDLAAYQEAWRPYEETLEAQKQESDQYENQQKVYQQAYNAYEAELSRYNSAKSEQEQLMADYEQAYEEYERQLAAYEQAYEEYERQREAYDQAQTAYQRALTDYETAVAAMQEEEPPPATKATGTVSSMVVLLAIGALVAVFGIILLILVDNALPGVLALIVGFVLALVGSLRKAPPAAKMPERAPVEKARQAFQKPEPPEVKRPEPIAWERPKAPQRPKLAPLAQPQPPSLPKPIPPSGEQLNKPTIERPQQPTIYKPTAPAQKQPEPPAPPPPAPVAPTFDEQRLLSTAARLNEILEAADCASVEELNKRFAEVVSLRNRQDTARSRLDGLLGDSTVEALEEQRREASRLRRDAEEVLDESGLQLVARMTPLEVNKLKAGIEKLEEEQAELVERRRRLQVKLEELPVSTEDLLRAEEALEAAIVAYERTQERIDVYQLTYDLLDEARTRTLKRAQEQLGPQTVTYLERLTHGRYRQAWIDSDLHIELEDPTRPDRRIQPERLSRGAQDQLYMAARLALVNLLFPNTRPPILLDDPFVHFDPQRLAAAIEMCIDVAAERQILLFTCSNNYDHVGHHILMPTIQT